MSRLLMFWRRLDIYVKALIGIELAIIIFGAWFIWFMSSCTLNVTISNSAPGLEVPADQPNGPQPDKTFCLYDGTSTSGDYATQLVMCRSHQP